MLKINFSSKTISHINEKFLEIKSQQNNTVELIFSKLNINEKITRKRNQSIKNNIFNIETELLPNIKKQLEDIIFELLTLNEIYDNN